MRLCDDEIWTVRRACAEVMPIMALLCTLEKRRKVLVPAMKKFMFDPSQWVIIAALKVSPSLRSPSLGKFFKVISVF